MDELRSFFNNPGAKPIVLRGGRTNGLRLTKEDSTLLHERKEEHQRTVLLSGTDYAREVKERELNHYIKVDRERRLHQLNSAQGLASDAGFESMESLSLYSASHSNINIPALTEEAMLDVYKKYSFQVKEDTNNLPINDFKQDIICRIRNQQIVIIEGPTGCGKTTQVPQWILDNCYQHRENCKIVITQPRRIAAISIAKRVALERGWDVGGLVGYQVGLENKTSTDTRIHYVTTGVLLQKLVSSKTLSEYTHIVLDEVHERGQEMDFLLIIVKKLLHTVSHQVKVILMSATFNMEAFSEYFVTPTPRGFEPSSCIRVNKKQTMFTVKTFYLNQLTKFKSVSKIIKEESSDASIEPDMYKLVVKLINAFETIDEQEEGAEGAEDLPSVLVFLPGINEIEEQYGVLTDLSLRREVVDARCAAYNWWVLPLHSTITADEQVRVFQRAPPGHRKVILSTNIAESSITVPDIKYVIDFCLMKVLVVDEQTNFTSLQLQWAAKSNCQQRAGRAGRVRDGRVYRLVTETFYEELNQDCTPEIKRCPLERLVLLAKQLDAGAPSDVLALAMDPPDLANVHRTTLVLKELGALRTTLDGVLSLADGDITHLGHVMARLPLDVRASKLIVLGHVYGCLEETVIMAAAMSVKSIFSSPFRERLNAYNSKLTWADGSTSDCIAFLNVYKVWTHLRRQQYFKQPGNNEFQWARRFYVQVRALRELDDMVRELNRRLAREGIEPLKGRSPWSKSELPLLLKMLIAGAFYPHYFVQSCDVEGRERDAVKTLGGQDPRTTVYLKNFPPAQPGQLYAAAIRKKVQQLTGDEPRVTFDSNSQKVYLTFEDTNRISSNNDKQNSGNPTMPGNVVLPVYKAIKVRQLKIDIPLALLPPDKARELAGALEHSRAADTSMVPRLPELDDSYFPLKISQFVNCGRFWVQHDDESTASDLRAVHAALNKRPLLAATAAAAPGALLAAPYQDDSGVGLFRVCVLRVMPRDMVWVQYIDFGSFGRVHTHSLRELPAAAAARAPAALECVLAEVAPSALLDVHGQWTAEATRYFQEFVERGRLMGKVYSVFNGVVAIELLADGGRVSVNQALLDRGFAQPAEESYESKINHDLRETAHELNMAVKRAHNRQQQAHAARELRELSPPRAADCVAETRLQGPFSPLESSLRNLMYSGRSKQVAVEWSSVNSVLLDTEPQEMYERLMVAGVVGTNESGGKLTLRHTTLMPNLPGLPAIVALLFCPNTEFRRDASETRYVSALCGLGSDEDGTPLFPEHDLLVDIDAELTNDDVALINHMRHLMDCGARGDAGADDAYRLGVLKVLREDLLKLIRTRRRAPAGAADGGAWRWRSVSADDTLEVADDAMLRAAELFPLHAPLELRARDADVLRALRDQNDALHRAVERLQSSKREVSCALCGAGPLPPPAMRIHLQSRAHRGKEADLRAELA